MLRSSSEVCKVWKKNHFLAERGIILTASTFILKGFVFIFLNLIDVSVALAFSNK